MACIIAPFDLFRRIFKKVGETQKAIIFKYSRPRKGEHTVHFNFQTGSITRQYSIVDWKLCPISIYD